MIEADASSLSAAGAHKKKGGPRLTGKTHPSARAVRAPETIPPLRRQKEPNMIVLKHRPTVSKTLRLTTIGLALLVLAALPWWAACDPSSIANALPAPSADNMPAIDPVNLAKASLADIDATVGELDQPQALAGDVPPPPPPCVEDIRQTALQCVEQTRNIVQTCISDIAQLFEQGQFEAAHMAAQACIEQINQHTEDCLQTLRQQCETCLADLIDQNVPPERLDALLGACRRAARHILHARRAAVGAIRDALDRGVAARCMTEIHQLAVDCADQNAQNAADCVAQIEALLANGQSDEAIATGRACIREIRTRSTQCAREIQARCHECLAQLLRNCGESEVVRRLLEACRDNLHLVLRSAHQAVSQIRDALPPPPDGQPTP